MDITSFILSILSWLAPLIVIGIIVLVIVSKVRSASQKYLGMSPSQAMELINKGVKEEATTPKGITALSEMYGPAITRDFPEIGYKGMEVKARNAIVAILNAIMNKNAESLKASEYTQDLINKVNNRITTLNANNEKEIFNNIKIHRCGIANYQNRSKEATARFEISLQYEYAKVSEEKADSAKPALTQTAYSVTLAYSRICTNRRQALYFQATAPTAALPLMRLQRARSVRTAEAALQKLPTVYGWSTILI